MFDSYILDMMYVSSEGPNESNSHYLVATSEMKIFYAHDLHHVQKVGIKRFCAQRAEISLTAVSLFQQAR